MCILRITCFVCYYLSLVLLFRVLLFNKLFLSHYRSFFLLIYFLRVVFPIKRVILVSVFYFMSSVFYFYFILVTVLQESAAMTKAILLSF